jgi:large subunit ribosomal protein L13
LADDAYIIDATGLLVGRLATRAAREAMHGRNVRVINCEKAAISGRKHMVIAQWKRRYGMGVPRKGPFVDRQPDKFVRRIIRGMLPHKTSRGRAAFALVMCYVGAPKEFGGKHVTFEDAGVAKLPTTRHITIGELCRQLGGKWYE